jgi:hypothetical protein
LLRNAASILKICPDRPPWIAPSTPLAIQALTADWVEAQEFALAALSVFAQSRDQVPSLVQSTLVTLTIQVALVAGEVEGQV